MIKANEVVVELLSRAKLSHIVDTVVRIDFFSQLFLGRPYLAGAQGEGVMGEFDQSPLYRFDAFDCVTYVNNILALSLSQNVSEFQKKLLQINYYHADPKYENRFHFMSVDWNPQNQKNNIVRDITAQVIDENKKSIVAFAEGEIDRPNWFLYRIKETRAQASVQLDDTKKTHAQARAKLRELSQTVKKEFVRLPYLPLSQLFDEHKNPRTFLFNQIPSGSVVEIVRPNWDLKEKIGTNLHVSHVGFAIRNDLGELLFRHASQSKGVTELPLEKYLWDCIDSPTIRGINLQAIDF